MGDRERFLALCKADDVWLRELDDRVELRLRGVHRTFAAYVTEGDQRGIHLRAESGIRSTAFRGTHNWIYLAKPVWAQLPGQIAAARAIASKRNASKSGKLDIYQPLARALAVATAPPTDLHAGGPRAKVLSGERDLAVALCTMCMDRLGHLHEPGDTKLLAKLTKMLARNVSSTEWWPAANAVAYGTDAAKRAADEAESAAVQMARAAVGASNAGSQSCNPFVTKALTRAVRELERTESPAAATTFLISLDEEIMRRELVAAITQKTKSEPPAIERVLWRGADAKGYPAWWLARLADGTYGVLGKLGNRWTWLVDSRDAALATIPDDLLEAAADIALARDAG